MHAVYDYLLSFCTFKGKCLGLCRVRIGALEMFFIIIIIIIMVVYSAVDLIIIN